MLLLSWSISKKEWNEFFWITTLLSQFSSNNLSIFASFNTALKGLSLLKAHTRWVVNTLMKLSDLKVRWIVTGTLSRTESRQHLNTNLQLFISSKTSIRSVELLNSSKKQTEKWVGYSFPTGRKMHLKCKLKPCHLKKLKYVLNDSLPNQPFTFYNSCRTNKKF